MTPGSARRRTAQRLTAFRLVKRKFAANAFSGEGARLYGGRWNSVGTSRVYTAGALSLAVLEWRVHLAQWPAPLLAVIEVSFDEALVWTPGKLPAGWKRYPSSIATARFGDAWIKSQRSAIMRVPSAIVPDEWNYLINPAHPDFAALAIRKAWTFDPDPRLG